MVISGFITSQYRVVPLYFELHIIVLISSNYCSYFVRDLVFHCEKIIALIVLIHSSLSGCHGNMKLLSMMIIYYKRQSFVDNLIFAVRLITYRLLIAYLWENSPIETASHNPDWGKILFVNENIFIRKMPNLSFSVF